MTSIENRNYNICSGHPACSQNLTLCLELAKSSRSHFVYHLTSAALKIPDKEFLRALKELATMDKAKAEKIFKARMALIAQQYGIPSWSSLIFEHQARKRRFRDTLLSRQSRGMASAKRSSTNAPTPSVGAPVQKLAPYVS